MSGWHLLAPLGLVALIGVPLVVFFHMRHTTPSERRVPTVRFWRTVAPTPADDARLKRPPLSLLLVLQLLAVCALALALARPAISGAFAGLTGNAAPVHLIVLLDGSTSMEATDTETGQRRFDVAKSLAAQRIGALHDDDAATVLVMGSSIQSLQATGSASMRSMEDRLRALSLPGGRADLNSALSLASNLLLPDMDDQVIVITDGAVAVDPVVAQAAGAPIELVQVGQPNTPNLAVVQLTASASATNAGGATLFGRLANFGGNNVDALVTLLADGIEVQTSRASIPAGATIDFVSNPLLPGVSRARLELREADAFPADNSAEVILSGASDLAQRILLVSDTPLVLQKALSALPGAQITTISTSDHLRGNLGGGPYDLTVFEDFTPASASDITTPVLFVHPPVDGLLPATGVMSNSMMQYATPGDPLLRGVELIGLSFGETPVHPLGPNDTEVVAGENGPLIYRGVAPDSDEPMVVLAFGLQEHALPQRIAFPILIANIVQELAPAALPASAILGDPLLLHPHAGAAMVQITAPDGHTSENTVTTGPDGTIDPIVYSETGRSGSYSVQELDRADRVVASGEFVIDAGHPAESNLIANPDLPATLALARTAADGGPEPSRSNDLWPLLAAAGFGLLALEWLVATTGIGRGWLARPPKRVRA